jgi:hypothetical protein
MVIQYAILYAINTKQYEVINNVPPPPQILYTLAA